MKRLSGFGFPDTAFFRLIALLLVLVSLGWGAHTLAQVWRVDDRGISVVADNKLPPMDFTNLWFSSKLAIEQSAAPLFDNDDYRAALQDQFGLPLLQEWSYPPHMLLFGAGLTSFPLNVAYVLWAVIGLLALAWLLRQQHCRPLCMALILCSPYVFLNQAFGQNGLLVAVLLLGGLLLIPSRPLLAGVLLGLLTVKPQFGLLVPLALLAGGHWRVVLSATLTFAAMALATTMIFGWSSWAGFFEHTMPMMTAIMEAPFPQGYHMNAVSLFTTARALGLSVDAAYAVQGVGLAACLLMTWRIWRRADMPHEDKVFFTVLLTYLATPYAYIYDGIALLAALMLREQRAGSLRYVSLLFWLLPIFWMQSPLHIYGAISFLFPAFCLLLLAGAWRGKPGCA